MIPWNKGLTKETSSSVRKTSDTMRKKHLDNFKSWRDAVKKKNYRTFKKDGDLAELLGVILGDGHIYKHDRCESLRIVADAGKPDFVKRYANIVSILFDKKPNVAKRKESNAVNITIYQKEISSRLDIPAGSRAKFRYKLPRWIASSHEFKLRLLRGLYEAEGSVSHSPATYTHKFMFSNANQHLLRLVASLVRELGFTVSVSANKAQVSRKEDVQKLANLLQFRCYNK